VFFLATRGLHLSIEFTGGTVMEVEYAQTADIGRTRATVEAMGFGEVQVQNFGTSRDVMIRLPVRDVKQDRSGGTCVRRAVQGRVGHPGHQAVHHTAGRAGQPCVLHAGRGKRAAEAQRTEFVGPSVGAELAKTARWRWVSRCWAS
jgi:preprotein translocase subunit SecF